MKLKNISNEEQRVMPAIGLPFSCAAGAETAEIHPFVSAELLSLPSIWAAVALAEEITKSTRIQKLEKES